MDYTSYTYDTVKTVGSSVLSMQYDANTLAVVLDSLKRADDFDHTRETDISAGLENLSRSVQGLLYFTVAITFVCLLIGVASGLLHIPKLALGLAFFLMLVLALVWADFTIAYAASNVFNKLCDTINNCHFCIVQAPNFHQPGCFAACAESWFMTMQECNWPMENNYMGLTNLVNNRVINTSIETCTALNDLCTTNLATVECVYTLTGNCTVNFVENGLSLLIRVNGQPNWLTLQEFNGTVPVLDHLTMNVLSIYSTVTTYQTYYSQMLSLNCNAPNAYTESVPGPGLGFNGIFNRLQEQVCPAITDPEYSIFEMVQLLAIGLIIMGVFIPCAQILLCLGIKRFAPHSTKPGLYNDEEEDQRYLINDTKSPDNHNASIFK